MWCLHRDLYKNKVSLVQNSTWVLIVISMLLWKIMCQWAILKWTWNLYVFGIKSDSQIGWQFQKLHVLVFSPPMQFGIHLAIWVLQVIYNHHKLVFRNYFRHRFLLTCKLTQIFRHVPCRNLQTPLKPCYSSVQLKQFVNKMFLNLELFPNP